MVWMGYPVRECKKCGRLYAGYWCPQCDGTPEQKAQIKKGVKNEQRKTKNSR